MAPLNVCMVGTGEYTTGFVGGGQSGSDKKVGVVGLTLFDLRRRGKVGKLSMAGTTGNKYAPRKHYMFSLMGAHTSADFQAYESTFIRTSPKRTMVWTRPSIHSQAMKSEIRRHTEKPSMHCRLAMQSPSSHQIRRITQ